MTDPAVGAILAHLDVTMILSLIQAVKGIYPAVDPLALGSALLDRAFLGERHDWVAQAMREYLAHYRSWRISESTGQPMETIRCKTFTTELMC